MRIHLNVLHTAHTKRGFYPNAGIISEEQHSVQELPLKSAQLIIQRKFPRKAGN